MEDRPSRAGLVVTFLLIYIIWGSTYLAIRYAVKTLPPFLMAGSRFMVAGLLLYGWSLMRGAPKPRRRTWLAAGIVGALLLLGGNGSVTWAEQRVPSGLAALLVATEPLWIALLDWMRPGGIRPRPLAAFGVVVGFAGVALLLGGAAIQHGSVLGEAVVIFAALSWAAGSLYSRSAPLPTFPGQASGMQMLVGGGMLLAVGLMTGEASRLRMGETSLESVLALLYLIVFGSLVAFSAYAWLVRHASPSKVSTYAYVNPVVAVFLGWWLAGEVVTFRTIIAAVIIVGSVGLITASEARPIEVEETASPAGARIAVEE